MEFRILGPIQVSEGGRPLEVGAGKQRALLALLLLRAGEVVSTDRLIDALWEEHPPASALRRGRARARGGDPAGRPSPLARAAPFGLRVRALRPGRDRAPRGASLG